MTRDLLAEFNNFKRTWTIQTELPVTFCIKYSSTIFDIKNNDLMDYGNPLRKIVVVDKTVFSLYRVQIESYFQLHDTELVLLIVDATEGTKNWDNVDLILKFFEQNNVLRRSEPVIAIGGGVLLDIVGFCASIYRRGIPYIKVPTTLLAIVDASVGAKVGVNHLSRRNRIGTYYPPIATLLDKKFINTQSEREIVNGIAEVFKLAVIKNEELFKLLEENYAQLINEKFQYGAVPVRVINLAITGMIEELEPNLWERNLDRCVDFGHSFSPMIEMKNLPNMHHGEAVVLDCLFSSCLSHIKRRINKATLCRIFTTAKNLHLPTYHVDFTDINLLINALADTMKHRDNNQYLPIPTSVGDYTMLNNVTDSDIAEAILLFKEMNNG